MFEYAIHKPKILSFLEDLNSLGKQGWEFVQFIQRNSVSEHYNILCKRRLGSGVMSDFDVLTKEMSYSEEEANNMILRNKVQKLEELKLQILSQNPTLYGVGLPGEEV